jgi:TRAP-type C4-dicarboxylate transport system permease small subunit
MLITKFPPRVIAIIDCVTNFLSLAIYAQVTWQTIKYAQLLYSSHDVSGVLRLPVYPFLIVAAIGGLMYSLAMLASFFQTVKKAVRNEP